jgi:hypothetical protein
MIEASTQFMVGRPSTESGKCNSFNLDKIFGNDRPNSALDVADFPDREGYFQP